MQFQSELLRSLSAHALKHTDLHDKYQRKCVFCTNIFNKYSKISDKERVYFFKWKIVQIKRLSIYLSIFNGNQ